MDVLLSQIWKEKYFKSVSEQQPPRCSMTELFHIIATRLLYNLLYFDWLKLERTVVKLYQSKVFIMSLEFQEKITKGKMTPFTLRLLNGTF